ncbi:MAG: hypothetical protein IKI64_08040, partial [Clostridia bacterium]|nr:hypothetical protein [Clostridia bacterium]
TWFTSLFDDPAACVFSSDRIQIPCRICAGVHLIRRSPRGHFALLRLSHLPLKGEGFWAAFLQFYI